MHASTQCHPWWLQQILCQFFCFGAFAYKHSGVIYNNLTGNFPFMWYNGSVCFIIMYHYKAIAIPATPITGLENMCIFKAYKKTFIELAEKGFKSKLNIMDNQAMKHIKKNLSEEECKLQLVKPHNHCMNAAKHARHIKMCLLWLRQPIAIFHSNCGTGWHPKSLIALTWCGVLISIQLNQHTKSYTNRTIGTTIHLRLWGARRSYTKMETPEVLWAVSRYSGCVYGEQGT
jgi:hypothetical protein